MSIKLDIDKNTNDATFYITNNGVVSTIFVLNPYKNDYFKETMRKLRESIIKGLHYQCDIGEGIVIYSVFGYVGFLMCSEGTTMNIKFEERKFGKDMISCIDSFLRTDLEILPVIDGDMYVDINYKLETSIGNKYGSSWGPIGTHFICTSGRDAACKRYTHITSKVIDDKEVELTDKEKQVCISKGYLV